ncbi:MAG: arsenosugar biosynthesis radical SAM protein ArsS [Planctomycetes bacterium]|nr:arsenosugar biosynthesis radical SAM protein ArsS [Planctomycetota bacterium]
MNGGRFGARLERHGLSPLRRRRVTTLQVNVGKLCDLACRHCHVEAGPKRSEAMDARTAARVLEVLAGNPALGTLDVTGGAPELNPNLRDLVRGARALGRHVMVRCNLTVLLLPEQQDTAAFYAAQRVHVVASLPCYTQANVDAQRGGGTFAGSIEALRRLNALGYGAAEGRDDEHALRLDLVYNPLGPSLPGPQAALERDYRARLGEDHGVVFDRLYTLANVPIHRFGADIERQGRLDGYVELLETSFNPAAAHEVMCRDLLSVDHDGSLHDCDFNLVLDIPLGGRARTIFELDDVASLTDASIATADHCLACTAGAGSSCGGALT